MGSRRVGLVLGSGSARGYAHIGVLKVWEREGWPLDLIVGCSMGALIGGVRASGRTAPEIEELALSIDFGRVISLFADPGLGSIALTRGRRVERYIRTLVGGMSFAETEIPFACVATDMEARREVVLQEGDLATAIRASIALPGVFTPESREGLSLVDGGVLNPVPADVARSLGADLVIAVSTYGVGRQLSPLSKGPYGSISLMQDALAESHQSLADVVIMPEMHGIAPYDFHEAQRIIAMGEQAAEQAVETIKKIVVPDGNNGKAEGLA